MDGTPVTREFLRSAILLRLTLRRGVWFIVQVPPAFQANSPHERGEMRELKRTRPRMSLARAASLSGEVDRKRLALSDAC
jgi:hypothetical protein